MSTPEEAATAALDRAVALVSTGSPDGHIRKTDRDFATATDFAVEDALREFLADLTPDIGFLGEERGHTGRRDRYWCLDPIDGTTNYSRGVPNYGVSLALIDAGQPVLGAIDLPAHRERYTTRDDSAYCNGRRTAVSTTSDPNAAIVSVGDFATGHGSTSKNRDRLATIGKLADWAGRIRMLGSAATDLAWLARGRIDAVMLESNHTWDVAAGVALARAAGAIVTHLDGSPHRIDGPNILAATPGLHRALIDRLGTASAPLPD
ncbi:MAG: inositol monophosphatase family protein [Phycicoccus sp.]